MNVDGDNKMNVLLLTMSILPAKGITRSLFTAKEDDAPDGQEGAVQLVTYGQMEPIPLYFQKKGQRLDKIIVLATPETTAVDDYKWTYVNEEDGSEEVPVREIRESACSFFKKRMKEFGLPDGRTDEDDRIEVIEIKPDSVIDGISDTVRRLITDRNACRAAGKEMALYLDIHGGLRDNQIVIDAIVSLLKTYNMEPVHTFSVQFDPKQKLSYIKYADESLQMFDFVAGMNEFFNYGRSETLAEFFRKIDVQQENAQELVEAINKISDCLAICRVSALDRALKDLSKCLKKIPDNGTSQSPKGYISIFKQRIQEEYGPLLNGNPQLFDEIQWAFRKGMYQQCLALIEAKTPEWVRQRYFMDKKKPSKAKTKEEKISEDRRDKRGFLRNVSVQTVGVAGEENFNDCQRLSSPSHEGAASAVMKLIPNTKCDDDGKKRIYIEGKKLKYVYIYNEFDRITRERTSINMIIGIPLELKWVSGKEEEITDFLVAWKVAKELRNEIMHAKEDEVEPEKEITVEMVSKTIRTYLEAFQKIV